MIIIIITIEHQLQGCNWNYCYIDVIKLYTLSNDVKGGAIRRLYYPDFISPKTLLWSSKIVLKAERGIMSTSLSIGK